MENKKLALGDIDEQISRLKARNSELKMELEGLKSVKGAKNEFPVAKHKV